MLNSGPYYNKNSKAKLNCFFNNLEGIGLQLTQRAKDNRPASILVPAPKSGDSHLILRVSLQPAQYNRIRIARHLQNHSVTNEQSVNFDVFYWQASERRKSEERNEVLN
jgi:hypothetical protein